MRWLIPAVLLLLPHPLFADIDRAIAAFEADDLETAAVEARAALEDELSPDDRLYAREILAVSEYFAGRVDFALRDELLAIDAEIAATYGTDAAERLNPLYSLSGLQFDLGLVADATRTDILMARIAQRNGATEDLVFVLGNLAVAFQEAGEARTALLYAALYEFMAVDLLGPSSPFAMEATVMVSRALLADGQTERAFQRYFTRSEEDWSAFAATGPDENELVAVWFDELDRADIGETKAFEAAVQAEFDLLSAQEALHDEIDALLTAGQFDSTAPEFLAARDRMRAFLDMAYLDDPMVSYYASLVLAADLARGDFSAARPYLMAALSYPANYAAALAVPMPVIAATIAGKGGAEPELLEALIAQSFAIDAVLPIENPEIVFDLHRGLAQLRDAAGDRLGALEAYRAAIETAAETDADHSQTLRATLGDAATVASELGLHEDAKALNARFLEASRTAGDQEGVSSALRSLALNATALGDADEALSYSRESLDLELARENPDRESITGARLNLAVVMMSANKETTPELAALLADIAAEPTQGEMGDVIATLLIHVASRLGVTPATFQDDPVFSKLRVDDRARIISLLAEVAADQEDYALAADWAALGDGMAVPASDEFFRLKEVEGRVALSEARVSDALMAFRAISDHRARPEARSAPGALNHLPYHIAAAIALAVDPSTGGDTRFHNEAFLMAQLASATAAGGALNAAMARGQAEGNVRALLRERDGLAREIAGLNAALARARYSGLSAEEIELNAAALRERHRDLSDEISREAPELASMAAFNPLGLTELAGRMRADEALLLYATSDVEVPGSGAASFVIALGGDAVMVAPLPSRADLGALARELRCAAALTDPTCAGGAEGTTRGSFQMPGAAGDGLAFDTELAHRAYQSLIEPVSDLTRGKERLIVVPDQTLVALPFHLLLAAPTTAGAPLAESPWLLRDHSIEIAPTVASFAALRDREARQDAPARFLGVGDPLIGAQKNGPVPVDCAPADPRPILLAEAVPDALQRSAGAARMQMISDLSALPEARCELEAIASGFPEATLLLQHAATEDRIKSLSDSGELSTFDVVSFATHGLVAGEIGVNDSGLVLTPPPVPTARDDGLLATAEIADLELDADFVILSACNTASGDSQSDEGLSGMASAFFLAGARSLLVSHWPVFSDAAVDVTTRSLALLEESPGLPRAEAVRRAMLAILDSPTATPREQHPSYWGAFMIVGDGLGS